MEVIQRSTEFLARRGVDSPRLQVELLLAHVLGLPRLKLYLEFDRRLTEGELDQVRQLLKRRGNREPLQHLVGSTSFCGLEIEVNRDVLIPRPETEVLAEHGWQFLQKRREQGATELKALDFGTGSGCLALALAAHVPEATVYALDISARALETARANAARHGLSERIGFVESRGFSGLESWARFDLVVANPPYIPTGEIQQLAPEVREHDPRLALDGGQDGLEVYRLLAQQAQGFIKVGGRFMGEFGDGQEAQVQRLFQECGWNIEAVRADLSGRPRILVAWRAES